MWVYARQFVQTLGDGLRPVQKVIAAAARVSEETVSRAMQKPEFRGWLEGQLAEADSLRSRLIKSRVAGQALAGSERHQRLWFELTGSVKGGSVVGDGSGATWIVNIGVPQTPPPDALPAIDVTV